MGKTLKMHISKETGEEVEERLIRVLKSASLEVFDGAYYFKEMPANKFCFEPKALAMIKDNKIWSFLIPSESSNNDNFKIFSFHFTNELDNSGFIGWLASKIKKWAPVFLLFVVKT